MESRVAALVADAAGLQAVRTIIEEVQVQLGVAPGEVALSAEFMEPLLEMAVNGELVELDSSNEPGMFGGPDLLCFVVVPLVVSTLEKLLERHVTPGGGIEKVLAEVVTLEEARRVVRQVGSRHSHLQVNDLTRSLRQVLAAHVGSSLRRVEG
jgi:hypothetical protein